MYNLLQHIWVDQLFLVIDFILVKPQQIKMESERWGLG